MIWGLKKETFFNLEERDLFLFNMSASTTFTTDINNDSENFKTNNN